MREIKFRQAILNRDGSFQSWHYWGFIEQYGSLTFVGPDTLYSTIAGALKNSSQYTGPKDKNGKEIYERDIIKFADWIEETIGEVKVGEFMAIAGHDEVEDSSIDITVYGLYIAHGCETSPLTSDTDCEVIGNIYENPELLEAKDVRDKG